MAESCLGGEIDAVAGRSDTFSQRCEFRVVRMDGVPMVIWSTNGTSWDTVFEERVETRFGWMIRKSNPWSTLVADRSAASFCPN